MSFRNIGYQELTIIIKKLNLQEPLKRRAAHPVYWYWLDGKKTRRVTLPNHHGGSGSLSTGFLRQIRSNLGLNTRQFVDLVECPLTPEQFAEIVRSQDAA